jgi:hypothetical protein
MSRLLLRRADCIHTCDDARQVIRDGYVLIEDGRIAAVGPEPAPPLSADQEISVAECLVTPGLINIHHHLYQTLTRAVPLATRSDILGWLYAMYPIWAEIDVDAYYWAALATSCELLASGCTTNADFAYLMPEADGEMAAEEIRGVREAGIRFSDRGGMPNEADLEACGWSWARLERPRSGRPLFPCATLRRYRPPRPGRCRYWDPRATYHRPQPRGFRPRARRRASRTSPRPVSAPSREGGPDRPVARLGWLGNGLPIPRFSITTR